jgi:hypothetical protein
MENLNNYSNSELLTLYVDGELDQSHEAELFQAIAENDELQQELNELLSIKESVRNDVEAYTPPPELKQAVFERVGFVPESTKPIVGFWNSFAGKFLAPVGSAVLASIVTAILILNFYEPEVQTAGNPSADKETVRNEIPSVSSSLAIDVNQAESSSGSISSSEQNLATQSVLNSSNNNSTHALSTLNGNHSSAGALPLARNSDDIALVPVDLTSESAQEEIYLVALSNSMIEISNTEIGYSHSSPSYTEQSYESTKIYRDRNNIGLSLQIRGISTSNFPNIKDEPNSTFFSDYCIAFFRPINDNLSYGIEVGNEVYNQKFFNEDFGALDRIEQSPSVMWVGLSFRGQLQEQIRFLGGAQPYAQVTLGGSQMGPVCKSTIGLQYHVNNLTLLCGLEGGFLAYQNQDRWYTSKKLGITYGVMLNF